MSFYQQSTISLYSWFLLVLSCNIFLMTFQGSIFMNIKLGPTTTSSPRRRGRVLHNPDSSHDQIRCFWLAEVRNFTDIMIEYIRMHHFCRITIGANVENTWKYRNKIILWRKKYSKCLYTSQFFLITNCAIFVLISTWDHMFQEMCLK